MPASAAWPWAAAAPAGILATEQALHDSKGGGRHLALAHAYIGADAGDAQLSLQQALIPTPAD